MAAVVGMLSYYDDQSLVVVMESTPKFAVSDRGPMAVHTIVKTAFLPIKPPTGTLGQWVVPGAGDDKTEAADPAKAAADKAAEEKAAEAAAKQRLQLKELLEAGDIFFAPGQSLPLCAARAAAARARGADPGSWDEADSRALRLHLAPPAPPRPPHRPPLCPHGAF